jgi:hypothetical protein
MARGRVVPVPEAAAWPHRLLDVDETSYKGSPSTRRSGTEESWSEPLFLSHVWGGIVAVLGDKGRALPAP